MDRATRIAAEAALGLYEFSLSNTKDEARRLILLAKINELKIALGYY